METFTRKEGIYIIDRLIMAVQENKQYLSDIDGAIGDGDHGINMNKGFSLCREALDREPGDMVHALNTLSKILLMKIGGSMGPLYGKFFKAFGDASAGKETIGKHQFFEALRASLQAIRQISTAQPGDKTLMDTLVPAVLAFESALQSDLSFSEALDQMTQAAREGRDSTVDMVAKIGRASRLGERSRGVVDAGAASCCLILESMEESILKLIQTSSMKTSG